MSKVKLYTDRAMIDMPFKELEFVIERVEEKIEDLSYQSNIVSSDLENATDWLLRAEKILRDKEREEDCSPLKIDSDNDGYDQVFSIE